MKKKKILFVAILGMMVGFSSCTKEKVWSEQVELESFVTKLKFETLENVLNKETFPLRGGEHEYISGELTEQICILICSWDGWGRKKYNCQHGWGLCNFRWFPRVRPYLGDPINVDIPSSGSYAGEVKTDSLGNSYLEILLSEAPTITDIPSINIDDDILGEPLRKAYLDENNEPIEGLPSDITLKEGVYAFDPNVGQYGGYRIEIE
ncbi:MAG: hypothetical protein K6G46_11205 [Prevotella sp.]|nr:hypothetical protein [Prevotella sp.]